MDKPKLPSLVRIITTDYASFLGFAFPIVAWLFYLLLAVSQKLGSISSSVPLIFAAITLAAAGVLAWRIRLVRSIFNDGMETPGVISHAAFFRDRGRIEYTYPVQDLMFRSGNAVMKVKRTRALQPGDRVTVVADPNNPRRALLRDLYL